MSTMQRGARVAAASFLLGLLAHAFAESSVSLMEFVNEKNSQIREKVLKKEFDKTVADMLKPLRLATDSQGVKKSEERLRRDGQRADRIQYISETYNSEKLTNLIWDAYVRNPYQPLDKILMTFLSLEVKAQESAASKNRIASRPGREFGGESHRLTLLWG